MEAPLHSCKLESWITHVKCNPVVISRNIVGRVWRERILRAPNEQSRLYCIFSIQTMKKPLIVLTNDDGIGSPGLRAAAEAIAPLGELVIVAPTNQQTSMSRSYGGHRDERLARRDFRIADTEVRAYHCNCSPAHAILHSMNALFHSRKPDLLVSGINYGDNLATNITISGTVGAAIEGASHGIPSLAVSLQTETQYHFVYGEMDWGAAKHFSRLFAKSMIETQLPPDVDLLNVNVPASATSRTEWRVTRLARQPYFQSRMESPSESSRLGDGAVTIDIQEDILEVDSDIRAITMDRVVSVTPVSIDLTSRVDLSLVKDLLCPPDPASPGPV